jgi:hypothetical protein
MNFQRLRAGERPNDASDCGQLMLQVTIDQAESDERSGRTRSAESGWANGQIRVETSKGRREAVTPSSAAVPSQGRRRSEQTMDGTT